MFLSIQWTPFSNCGKCWLLCFCFYELQCRMYSYCSFILQTFNYSTCWKYRYWTSTSIPFSIIIIFCFFEFQVSQFFALQFKVLLQVAFVLTHLSSRKYFAVTTPALYIFSCPINLETSNDQQSRNNNIPSCRKKDKNHHKSFSLIDVQLV